MSANIPLIQLDDARETGGTAPLREQIFGGFGTVVVRTGAGQTTYEQVEAYMRMIASQLGDLLPQDGQGQIVHEVRFQPGSHVRGAKTRSALPFHTDLGPTRPRAFLLACVQHAAHGGETILADAGRAARFISSTSGDSTYEALEKEFPFDISDNGATDAELVRWYPIFKRDENHRFSATYNRARIHRGFRACGFRISPEQASALDALDSALARPEATYRITLEAGDILVVNNTMFLHSRTEFSDDPEAEQQRLLLRAWVGTDEDATHE